MIRSVLDTNVLASGIVGFLNPRSIPGELLRLWRQDVFDLVLSDPIQEELERTLTTRYFKQHIHPEQVARVRQLLARYAIRVRITAQVQGVATHPEDDLILATAVSAKAQYLVTGDHGLQTTGRTKVLRSLQPVHSSKCLPANNWKASRSRSGPRSPSSSQAMVLSSQGTIRKIGRNSTRTWSKPWPRT